jgi:hypothetical protein
MTIKRRGNPNWGKPVLLTASGLSAFESLVRYLKLSPEEYEGSITLKEWVCQNKDHRYVPVELLKAWGLTVRAESSAKLRTGYVH